jgi:hypothetical protein
LGYLGGVLIVVAASLIANWYWADIPIWDSIALRLFAAPLLAAAGWLAYRRPSEPPDGCAQWSGSALLPRWRLLYG